MKHLFVFTDTTMTYNGKPFMPGMSIGELCEIFGNYDVLLGTRNIYMGFYGNHYGIRR